MNAASEDNPDGDAANDTKLRQFRQPTEPFKSLPSNVAYLLFGSIDSDQDAVGWRQLNSGCLDVYEKLGCVPEYSKEHISLEDHNLDEEGCRTVSIGPHVVEMLSLALDSGIPLAASIFFSTLLARMFSVMWNYAAAP